MTLLSTWALIGMNMVHVKDTNSYKKKNPHPFLLKLEAFYSNLLQILPVYVNCAPSSVMKPLIALPNIAKKYPKRQELSIHVNARTPLPGRNTIAVLKK